jgi:hypothetical protein
VLYPYHGSDIITLTWVRQKCIEPGRIESIVSLSFINENVRAAAAAAAAKK